MNKYTSVLAFVERWTSKRDRYDTDSLNDCFDRFFTSFVIYNFIYGWISRTECYIFKGDRQSATQVPTKFLMAKDLRNNSNLSRAATSIAELIVNHKFILRDPSRDLSILKKLNSKNHQQWCEGMMEAVYYVRCNTFHGGKGFEEHQREILIPCILIVEIVSECLLEKIKLLK